MHLKVRSNGNRVYKSIKPIPINSELTGNINILYIHNTELDFFGSYNKWNKNIKLIKYMTALIPTQVNKYAYAMTKILI